MIEVTSFETLDRLLEARADELGEATALRWLIDGERDEQPLSYRELRAQARAIAAHLQVRLPPGARALMLYPPGLEFVSAFFGCQLAGVVAVPAFPPDPSRLNRTLPRVVAIAADCGAAVVLTTRAVLDLAEALFDLAPELAELPWVATDEVPASDAGSWRAPAVTGASLAMLQYTSGSTASPKGVMLDHRAILINQQMMVDVSAGRDQGLIFSWLPTYHDMGLFAGVVYPISRGCASVLMSPLHFLQRPMRWMEGLSRTGATASVGPNFAFDLCVRKSTPAQRAALDLSRWEVALLGAEPTRPSTLDAFAEAFAVAGFKRQSFFPGYGLAEAVLSVSGGPELTAALHTDALASARVEPVPSDHPLARRLTSAGGPMRGLDIRIVDPDALHPLPPGAVGEIWIAGPTVGQGYWGRPELSEAVFRARTAQGEGPYLRTGDLGFFLEGRLFIAGRIKDMIIVRGRNLYPQDLELSVETCHPALRAGCSVALGEDLGDHEGVTVVAEITPGSGDPAEVAQAVRTAVLLQHEVDPERIVFIPPRALPKTSSGKVQRHAARDGLTDGSLEILFDSRTVAPAPRPPDPAPPATPDGLLGLLQRELATRLGVPAHTLAPDRPFVELGLDSRAAIELSGDLAALLGRPFSPTLFYEHPNLDALSRAISGVHAPASAPSSPRGPTSVEARGVAILGMSCRLPGGLDRPEALHEALCAGRDAITEIPPDRWDMTRFWSPEPAPGRSVTRHGGFLRGVELMDEALWGLSPREAEVMDPQHRLLLELAWEALEDAGVPPLSLGGQRVGVFVGISTQDYARRTLGGSSPEGLGAYAATGAAPSVAAGRISYHLDLRGPCFTVDTACSSALVAVVQAMNSLRRGECSLALVGGVNLILAPDLHIIFSQLGALSPDGRCRAFSEQARGYTRSEGGVVMLLGLEGAAGTARAILRGGAINHDGRTNGLTAPSRAAQVQVIRDALADARISAGELSFVEAHGTGTPLGDPIELTALAEAVGERSDPLWVGSIKSNIGHTEAAAGLAGLLKAALALEHGLLPPTLHAEVPTARVDWASLPLRLATSPVALPPRALAGVSSFGFSGTNAHVVLESAPPRPALAEARGPHLLVVSGRSEAAVRAGAARLAEALEAPEAPPLAAACATALSGRSPLDARAALVVDDRAGAVAALRRLVEAGPPPQGPRGRLAWLFTGQGSLRPGVGWQLREEPAFARTISRIDQALDGALDQPIARLLWPEAGQDDLLPRSTYAQPALYALEMALAALWRSWGVEPEVTMGHSLGTYAAATVAGVFSLEDGARLVAARGGLMDRPSTEGAMAAVRWGERALINFLISNNYTLSISASNGPTHLVLSGRAAELEAAVTELEARGVACTRLPVRTAYHSSAMGEVREALEALVARAPRQAPQLPLMSDLDGTWLGASATDPAWWGRHARETVRFDAGLRALAEGGINLCLEIGPDATLTAMGAALELPGLSWLSTLRRGRAERRAALEAAGALYERGALHPCPEGPAPGPGAPLPHYPWQRRRRWLEPGAPAVAATRSDTYKLQWIPAAPRTGAAEPPWLLIGDGRGLAARLEEALLVRGSLARRVSLDTLEEALRPGAHVLCLCALDADDGPIPLLRRLAALARRIVGRSHLTLLTRGAAPPGPPDPVGAAVVGFARCLALEHPGAVSLLDLDPRPGTDDVAALAALLPGLPEPELALRDGRLLAPRLEALPVDPGCWRPRGDRSYLVTGGLGGLGLALAAWLVRGGARWITLVGRRGLTDEGARRRVEALRVEGCDVQIVSADAGDREAMRAARAGLPRPLSGVFHAAGALAPAPALAAEAAISEALGGKLMGAMNLDQLTAALPVEVFVLLSSVAGVWGGLEQGAYSAANAGLDALARSRRARGLPATAVAFGPISGGGLSSTEALTRLHEAGLDPLGMEEALDALGGAMLSERAVTIVARGRWDRLATLARTRGQGWIFDAQSPRDLPTPAMAPGRPSAPSREALAHIREAPPAVARARLTALLADEIRHALGHGPEVEIPLHRGLVDLGLDSLMAVQLVSRLKALLGAEDLPATLAFEQPNLEALSRYVADEVLRLPPVPLQQPTEEELAARLEALLASL